MPRLDCCVCCGSRGQEFRFDAQQGGVLCLPCAKGSGMPISQETTWGLTKLQKSQKDGQSCLSESSINEARRVLSIFIHYQLGRKLRSLDLLEKIPK
jgi:recombinational DNA repair protein (RecF pathway)